MGKLDSQSTRQTIFPKDIFFVVILGSFYHVDICASVRFLGLVLF